MVEDDIYEYFARMRYSVCIFQKKNRVGISPDPPRKMAAFGGRAMVIKVHNILKRTSIINFLGTALNEGDNLADHSQKI